LGEDVGSGGSINFLTAVMTGMSMQRQQPPQIITATAFENQERRDTHNGVIVVKDGTTIPTTVNVIEPKTIVGLTKNAVLNILYNLKEKYYGAKLVKYVCTIPKNIDGTAGIIADSEKQKIEKIAEIQGAYLLKTLDNPILFNFDIEPNDFYKKLPAPIESKS
jgi:hypothetical protein